MTTLEAETQSELMKTIGIDLGVTEPQGAMFYYFKASGKYYTEGHGFVPPINEVWTRDQLLEINGGSMPGLNGAGLHFQIVVIPDEEAVYGWPQIKVPVDV